MKAIRRYIKDAKTGGSMFADVISEDYPFSDGDVYKLLLDPLAWQAVGKTRDWSKYEYSIPFWREAMHMFIDLLADGDSVEEALQALEAKTESEEITSTSN